MKVIWQNDNGVIYIGMVVCGYAVPVQEFKTFAELVADTQNQEAELIMRHNFIEYMFKENQNTRLSPKVIDYINNI